MARNRVNPIEQNNAGAVPARLRYGELRDENGAAPPPTAGFVQDCGSGWGSAGEPADKTFNDVPIDEWTRGGIRMPNFDQGNAWRTGKVGDGHQANREQLHRRRRT